MKYSVSIDVPSLDDGLGFYGEAFGLVGSTRPVEGYAVTPVHDAMKSLTTEITRLQHSAAIHSAMDAALSGSQAIRERSGCSFPEPTAQSIHVCGIKKRTRQIESESSSYC